MAALRGLRGLMRHGGLFAFHEIDFEFKGACDPSSALAETTRAWLREACRLAGIQLNAVSQMPRYFYEAGLGWPETVLHLLVSSGPDSFGPTYVVRTLRSLAPLLERSGTLSAQELDLDTLEARLRESCANGAASLYGVNGGVWARLK